MTHSENVDHRVKALRRACKEHPGGGAGAYQTPYGEVRFERVEIVQDGIRSYAEVYLTGEVEGGDPHFRIVNPPTVVIDAAGARREDPLAALAEVIGANGGATRTEKRSRR